MLHTDDSENDDSGGDDVEGPDGGLQRLPVSSIARSGRISFPLLIFRCDVDLLTKMLRLKFIRTRRDKSAWYDFRLPD